MARLNSPETGIPKVLNVRLKSAAHLRQGCKHHGGESSVVTVTEPCSDLFDERPKKPRRRVTHLHEMVFDPAQPLRLQESHVPMRIERDAVQSRDPPRLGLNLVLVPRRTTTAAADWSTLDVDVDSEGCLRLEKVRPSTGAFEAVVDDDDLISQPKRGVGSESAKRFTCEGTALLGGAIQRREAKKGTHGSIARSVAGHVPDPFIRFGVAYCTRDDCQRKKVDRTPRQASTLTNS